MSTIKISIETDNDAFSDGKLPFELARVLEQLAIDIHAEDVNVYEDVRLYNVTGELIGVMTYDI
jgi:hypothetical protein